MFKKLEIPCAGVKTMVDVLNDKENYSEGLLEEVTHPIAKRFISPTGGIFFSRYKKEKYKMAPLMNNSKNGI